MAPDWETILRERWGDSWDVATLQLLDQLETKAAGFTKLRGAGDPHPLIFCARVLVENVSRDKKWVRERMAKLEGEAARIKSVTAAMRAAGLTYYKTGDLEFRI